MKVIKHGRFIRAVIGAVIANTLWIGQPERVHAAVDIPQIPYKDVLSFGSNGKYTDLSGEVAFRNGYYFACKNNVPISGVTVDDIGTLLNARFPTLNISYEVGSYYVVGNKLYGIKESTFNKMMAKHKKLNELCRAAAMTCVPNGTPADNVPYLVAGYVADNMEYDKAALNNPALMIEYQNLEHFFISGKGVCTTYALAMNSITSSCPINAETGVVDWECKEPIHLRTHCIYNSRHAWSAVSFGKEWRYYDACNFDTTSGDAGYLNMELGVGHMTDEMYSDPWNLDSNV